MATGEKTRAGDEQFWRDLRFKENHVGDGFDGDCYSVYGDDSHVGDDETEGCVSNNIQFQIPNPA